MAENNAPAPLVKPLVEAKPGDPITAGRWNEMQSLMRSEHIQHGHTGVWKGDLFDGAPITAAGLANGAVTGPRIAEKAVTGDKIDPATSITAASITATGTLRAAALDLAETDEVVLRATDLKLGHSTRHQTPGRALTDLKTDGKDLLGLNADGDWKDGVKIGGALLVAGKTELADAVTAKAGLTVAGALTASNGLTVSGAVTANNGLTVSGAPLTLNGGLNLNGGALALNNGLTVSGAALVAKNGLTVTGPTALADLTVTGAFKPATLTLTESPSLTVPCSDLKLGHSTRRAKGPGRALVDWKVNTRESLVLNFEADWAGGVDIQSPLTVTGAATLQSTVTVAGAATLQSSLSVAGSATVQSSLTVAGGATMKGRPAVTGDAGSVSPRIIWGYIDENGTKVAGYGFTTEKVDGPGVKLRFTTGFRELPAVIVQQHGYGKTTDNALVYSVSTAEATVYNGDNNGDKRMRQFFFMAIASND